jgi:hypothetical protein
LVENVGFGGSEAAPLAGKLIEKYLKTEDVRTKTLQASLNGDGRDQSNIVHARTNIR